MVVSLNTNTNKQSFILKEKEIQITQNINENGVVTTEANEIQRIKEDYFEYLNVIKVIKSTKMYKGLKSLVLSKLNQEDRKTYTSNKH